MAKSKSFTLKKISIWNYRTENVATLHSSVKQECYGKHIFFLQIDRNSRDIDLFWKNSKSSVPAVTNVQCIDLETETNW